MQEFYKPLDGTLNQTIEVADTACRKLVADMWYETKLCAIIQWWAHHAPKRERRSVPKVEARRMMLTKEQILKVNVQHLIALINYRCLRSALMAYLMACRCLRGG